MAEPIEMPFGTLNRVGSRKVLDGVHNYIWSPTGRHDWTLRAG